MTWQCFPRERYTVDEALDLLSRHRLAVRHALGAAEQCAAIAQSDVREIRSGDGDLVATVFTRHSLDDFVAMIDIIPIPKYFRVREEYSDPAKATIGAVIEELKAAGAGRIWTQIPESRGRTMKAVKAAGFKYEGKLKKAANLGSHKGREDLYIYAYVEEGGDQ